VLACGVALQACARDGSSLFVSVVLVRAMSVGCLDAWPTGLVALWFTRRRGLANAALQVTGGLATGVVSEALTRGAEHLGWRATEWAVAAALCTLALPCAVTLRNKPADCGLLPDGDADPALLSAADEIDGIGGIDDADEIRAAEENCETRAVVDAREKHRMRSADETAVACAGVQNAPDAWAPPAIQSTTKVSSEPSSSLSVQLQRPSSPSQPTLLKTSPKAPTSPSIPSFTSAQLPLPLASSSPSLPPPSSPFAPSRRQASAPAPACMPRMLVLLHASTFWMASVGSGVDLYTLPIALEAGAAYDLASTLFVTMGLVTAAAALAAGAAVDKHAVSPLQLLAAGFVLLAANALSCLLMGSMAGGLAYGVSKGACLGVSGTAFAVVLPHLFGVANVGKLLGQQKFAMVAGTCFGMFLVGGSRDVFGSFRPILLFFALPSVGFACAFGAASRVAEPGACVQPMHATAVASADGTRDSRGPHGPGDEAHRHKMLNAREAHSVQSSKSIHGTHSAHARKGALDKGGAHHSHADELNAADTRTGHVAASQSGDGVALQDCSGTAALAAPALPPLAPSPALCADALDGDASGHAALCNGHSAEVHLGTFSDRYADASAAPRGRGLIRRIFKDGWRELLAAPSSRAGGRGFQPGRFARVQSARTEAAPSERAEAAPMARAEESTV